MARSVVGLITMSIIFLAVSSTFTGCSSDPEFTALEITIVDELGTPVSGATVKLFTSATHLEDPKNQVGTSQTSDSRGVVKFSNLSPIQYYWFIEKDCRNNYNGSSTLTSPLVANKTTTVNTVITPTGTLAFSSNSNNPYSVYVNGELVGTVEGNSAGEMRYVPIGSYSIRVLQQSGYLIYPTDQTYEGVLSCGGTLTVVFPY